MLKGYKINLSWTLQEINETYCQKKFECVHRLSIGARLKLFFWQYRYIFFKRIFKVHFPTAPFYTAVPGSERCGDAGSAC